MVVLMEPFRCNQITSKVMGRDLRNGKTRRKLKVEMTADPQSENNIPCFQDPEFSLDFTSLFCLNGHHPLIDPWKRWQSGLYLWLHDVSLGPGLTQETLSIESARVIRFSYSTPFITQASASS